MTTVTQRHINGIKSIFGGIKNWFQQKSESQQPKKEFQHSRLRDAISESRSDEGLSQKSKVRSSRLDDETDDNFREISSSSSMPKMTDEKLGMSDHQGPHCMSWGRACL